MTEVSISPFRVFWAIVSYGDLPGAGRLADSVGRLARDAGVDATVVVANNKAGDASFPASTTSYRTVHFPDNPGYLPAFARILSEEHSQGALFDYYVLSNSDLRLSDDFFVAWRSIHLGERVSNVGLLGPAILQGDGRDMNPYLAAPVELWRLWLYRALLALGLWGYWARSRERSALSLQSSRTTAATHFFAPHGSCLILTRHYFDSDGSIDYPVRLYGEELWLGCELVRIGLRPALVQQLAVFHEGSRTISAQPSRSISAFRRKYLAYWTGRAGRHRLRAAAISFPSVRGDGYQ